MPKGETAAFLGYGRVDLAAAISTGVRARLYDVDPRTLGPDLESVQQTLRRGVRAVVFAHLFGYPADMDGVRALATPRGITVIEDAAQGSGGTLRGRRIRSLGDLSVLSFGRGKGLCAGGGALLTFGDEWNRRLDDVESSAPHRGLPQLVKTAAQWAQLARLCICSLR